MKIVIAFDSFKGSLTARQACQIASETILVEHQNIKTILKPMADGGEGTVNAILSAKKGQWIPHLVMGPLPSMQVEAGFAWFQEEKLALVEMAAASGIELLSKEQLNPLKTTTYGTGQLIQAAIEYGAEKILLAVGGSATIDGGIGAAMALGWKFVDKLNNEIKFGGGELGRISKIIKPLDFKLPVIEVLCDVDNPLCGEQGAAKIFGPQKGALPEMVECLDKGLFNLSQIIKSELGPDVINLQGAGAAGGLSAGAVVFMNATLVSGVETVIEEIALEKEMPDADWIITGEGCFDHQSLNGKVISGIIKTAQKYKTKIAVIAGRVLLSQKDYKKHGISIAIPCKKDSMDLDYAIKNSSQILSEAIHEFLAVVLKLRK